MDDTDQRLIAELRRDGRAALSDLADRLGLSRATVRSRMERLTEKGEIAGFTVLTRSDVAAAPVRGLIMIGIEGKGGEQIGGDKPGSDLIAELATQTLLELDEVIYRIRSIEGVVTSETNLLLSTRKAGRK